MDMRLELAPIPVTDIDRARDFYVRVGFVLDHDRHVDADLRFVQLTPPGSACSIYLGQGLTDMAPGSQHGLQMVVDDADAIHADLVERGIEATAVEELAWGRFVHFSDPDGNQWSLQELPARD